MPTAVRFPAFLSVTLAVLATAAAVVLVVLLSGGWCDRALGLKETIELRDIQTAGGMQSYVATLPPARRGFACADDKTALFENGRELFRLPKGTPARGATGYFRHRSNTTPESIVFLPGDGSDPRENGRTYTLSVQRTPSFWLVGCLGLLAFGGWFLGGCRVPAGAPASRPGLRLPLLIFVAALSIRLVFLWLHPLFTDGLFAIQGVPFSDAKGWNSLAQSLIDGHGLSHDGWWSPKRPLFSICLALIYTWTGNSLIAAKCFLAVITAGTAAVAFLVFRRVAPLWVAVAAGLFIAFDRREVETAAVLLTEPLGIFFAVTSAWALIVGLQEKKGRWFFWAGVLFACSNLARPLTLPAFPLLIALIAGHGFLADRERLRVLFGRCALFLVGTFVCLAPWLVRQRVVHGIWAISDNTSSVLFAASSPEFRVWSPKVELEADRENAGGDMTWRYRYFNRRFHENLTKYPGYYFSHVVECLPQAVWQSNLPDWGRPLNVFGAAAVAATGLAGAIARRRRDEFGRRFVLLAGLLALAVLVFANGTAILIIAALGFVWCFRANPAGAGVLAVTFAGASLAAALFGNTALDRTRVLLEWVEVGWFFAGLYGLTGMVIAEFHQVSSLPARTADVKDEQPGSGTLWPRRILAVGLTLLLVSSVRLIWRTIHPPPAAPAVVISQKDRARLVREMAARHPELKALDAPALLAQPRDWQSRLFVEPVRVETYVYWFPKPPEVKLRSEAGQRFPLRDHPYTAFSCQATEPPMSYTYEITGFFAGPLPPSVRGQVCLAIGILPKESEPSRQTRGTVEILALIPGSKVEKKALDRAVVAPLVPETQRLIEALAPSGSAPAEPL